MKRPGLTVEQSTTATIVLSWFMLLASIIGWPVTSVTVFRTEPQGILGLSWVALIISAGNTLLTAYTKRQADTAAGNQETAT